MKICVDFKLDKNLSSELLNMDKTYDFVIKPLKNDPLETTVSIFFLEIEIFTTKIVNSKGLKKSVLSFCRRWTSLTEGFCYKNFHNPSSSCFFFAFFRFFLLYLIMNCLGNLICYSSLIGDSAIKTTRYYNCPPFSREYESADCNV